MKLATAALIIDLRHRADTNDRDAKDLRDWDGPCGEADACEATAKEQRRIAKILEAILGA